MVRISFPGFVNVLLALVAAAAHAQPTPPATVRVKIQDNVAVLRDTGATVVGELLRRDSSALFISRVGRPDTMRIAVSAIEWAEYLRLTGRDKGTIVRTAVLIGAVAGGVVGYTAGRHPSGDCIALCGPSAFAALGGAAGAVLGLVVGIPVAAATGDRWERFDPADVRVSAIALPPVGRGIGLALRWAP